LDRKTDKFNTNWLNVKHKFDDWAKSKKPKVWCRCEEPKRRSNPTTEKTLKLFGLPLRSFFTPRNDMNSEIFRSLFPLSCSLRCNDVRRGNSLAPRHSSTVTRLSSFFTPHSSHSFAFTLAEVLIVIGMIGIVANLTIPTLTQSISNSANAKSLLKIYAALGTAINLYIADNGADFQASGLFENGNDNTAVWNNYFKKYFIILEDCSTKSGCFPNIKYKYLSGNDWMKLIGTGTSVSEAVLNDGTLMRIWNPGVNCVGYCLEIVVDVNGFKGPNKVGRDTFLFRILKDKIIPFPSNNCYTDNIGTSCSSRVIQEGNINY